jgi:hypothetical protein
MPPISSGPLKPDFLPVASTSRRTALTTSLFPASFSSESPSLTEEISWLDRKWRRLASCRVAMPIGLFASELA